MDYSKANPIVQFGGAINTKPRSGDSWSRRDKVPNEVRKGVMMENLSSEEEVAPMLMIYKMAKRSCKS